jgi:ribosomal protein S18 acetylase RimI-like enzyme
MVDFEIRRITDDDAPHLADFFATIRQHGDAVHFHPHPFTIEEAQKRATYQGKDLFYIAQTSGRLIIGYGMLRGWDEGYATPSLGIIVHPDRRGTGLGRLLMHFLHYAARERGASKIRLKVYPQNTTARHLYETLGYVFEDTLSDGQLVGIKTLL